MTWSRGHLQGGGGQFPTRQRGQLRLVFISGLSLGRRAGTAGRCAFLDASASQTPRS